MIVVANPVDSFERMARQIAEKVLQTEPNNIVLSQWHVEEHDEDDIKYVVSRAFNRRLDPLDQPRMLHARVKDFDHLKMLFHHVEWVA